MRKVLIMTDSNSGITLDEAKTLGVEVIPMPFMINGECYFENINLTQEQFYNQLLNDASVSTSQPALGVLDETFNKCLETYDEIVYIPMSSGLSMSCYSAKTLAEQEFKDKVFVVDNTHISVTLKRSVLDALELANEGFSAKEIKTLLESQKDNSTIYILVDTLKYLKKGGRITPAVALIGDLFKIKPILKIYGDKLDKFSKTRTIDNAKRIMLNQIEEDVNKLALIDNRKDNIYIDIAYTYDDTEALKLAEEVKAHFNVDNILINPLSLSVSCHIGPNALAITATKKTLKNI